MKENIKHFCIALFIAAWAGISFLLLCSEAEVSLLTFIVTKLIAFGSLYACSRFLKYVESKGF